MKIKLIFFCTMLFSYIVGQETTIFKYDYHFKKDTLSDNTDSEEYLLFKVNTKNYFISESDLNLFELKYKPKETYKGDGKIKGNGKNLKPARLKSVEIDQDENPVFFKNYFNKLNVKYIDNVPIIWTLTNDTITYNGYPCKIAKTYYAGRQYVAYYTQKIPFPYGPYIFNNLPGLIVHVSDLSKNHIFDLIGIEKRNLSFSIEDYKMISKEKYEEIENEYKTNPFRLLLPNTNLSEEKKQAIKVRLKNKLKHDNNPIERFTE